ncbi:cholecystokinin receptor type A-like [Diadema setosum]|uniref:cholecystokinin receptor type A-like n=1 Tax=Diadema setosum TaxID=31175 RepID=UPI003B3B5231
MYGMCGGDGTNLPFPINQSFIVDIVNAVKDQCEDSESSLVLSESDQSPRVTWLWQPIVWSWVTILKMLAALLGIMGNLLVVLVLYARRRSSRSTDVLIGALAAADLLTSVFMLPLPVPLRVPQTFLGTIYCKVVSTSLCLWISIDASILTLTVIPLERYLAIAYPLRFKRLVTRKRVTIVIVTIWISTFMANLFLLVVTRVEGFKCVEIFPSRGTQLLVGFMLYFVMFLFPALIMLISQAQTALVLHRQSRLYLREGGHQEEHSNPSAKHLVAKKRVLKMLFVVVAVFILCWSSSQTAYLAYNLGVIPTTYLYSPLYNFITVLAFCNSCANPIIYAVRNQAFRTAVKDLFMMSSATGKTSMFSQRIQSKPEVSTDKDVV